jgi:hypothetical protein
MLLLIAVTGLLFSIYIVRVVIRVAGNQASKSGSISYLLPDKVPGFVTNLRPVWMRKLVLVGDTTNHVSFLSQHVAGVVAVLGCPRIRLVWENYRAPLSLKSMRIGYAHIGWFFVCNKRDSRSAQRLNFLIQLFACGKSDNARRIPYLQSWGVAKILSRNGNDAFNAFAVESSNVNQGWTIGTHPRSLLGLHDASGSFGLFGQGVSFSNVASQNSKLFIEFCDLLLVKANHLIGLATRGLHLAKLSVHRVPLPTSVEHVSTGSDKKKEIERQTQGNSLAFSPEWSRPKPRWSGWWFVAISMAIFMATIMAFVAAFGGDGNFIEVILSFGIGILLSIIGFAIFHFGMNLILGVS